MDVTHIIDGLNDPQREAVTAPIGNLLVVAGAGSGKTRVLVHRIAWLVEAEGASPGGVMAVTFTNKAAAEMRGRAERLLNIPARAMWVGTFHGIAHRLLRINSREAGLPDNFQILDADDQLRLVKRVMRSMDLDEKRWPPRQATWFINAQKDEGLRAGDLPLSDDLFVVTHKKVYEAYEELCQQGGLVDFAELLLRSYELWRDNAELLDHYQRRFRHLLVDEFQDTNTIQYRWLRALAGRDGYVMAVGDDDQSIYGWRGAKIENIHAYTKDLADVRVIRLEQNYRSTGTILKAANGLIDNNMGRLGKELWTASSAGDPILVYSAYNDLEEARFVADRSQAWIDGGGSPTEVAVLYRSNAQSRVIEEAFLRREIPYRIYGGMRFFERMEIRNALAYMRLLHDRHSDVAFERVVNTPPRGIGDRTIESVRAVAREAQRSMWQACKEAIAGGGLRGRAANALRAFMELIDGIAEQVDGAPLWEICEHCLDVTGLLEYHAKERGERGIARRENLEELVTACRQFEGGVVFPLTESGEETDQRGALEEFLDQAALESGDHQEDGPAVQMMTLHSAKGLEFPLVFMAGMEEGLFPNMRSAEEPGRMEEERRLAYVGITRAMKQLYLTHAESRRMRGMETHNRPSRFLQELPQETVEEVRLRGEVAQRFRPGARQRRVLEAESDVDGIRIGTMVRHPKFGEGVVLQSEGGGDRTRVQVNFARRVGAKWLMLSYAQLEVVGQ